MTNDKDKKPPFGRLWDATPFADTQRVTLVVSRSSTWAAVGGFFTGAFALLILAALAQSGVDARSVKNGLFTHDGKAYKLVEIKP